MKKTLILTATFILVLVGPGWALTASIGKNNVNVRQSPNLRAEVLFRAPLGYPVEIEQTKGKWVMIRDWQNDTGWVYEPLIEDEVQTAVVLKERINIRRGPGLRYRVVNKAERGEMYKIFGEKNDWVKIGYYLENKEIGWVRKDLVWGE